MTLKAWKKIGKRAHHGLQLPLAFLKSNHSQGIGDFGDLYLLLSFCEKCGFDIIQLLPIQDSLEEPSPYSAYSSCALHPIYIDLSTLPFYEGDHTLLNSLKEMQQNNSDTYIDYRAVYQAKIHFLREYCKRYGAQIEALSEFKPFIHSSPWLFEYGAFQILKSRFTKEPSFHWKAPYHRPNALVLSEIIDQNPEEYRFWTLVQFLAHFQLSSFKEMAGQQKCFLMGDMPLFVNRDSHDVWAHLHLFDVTLTAGAPPDLFNKQGQRWGLPIFVWPEHEKEQFSWWHRRLDAMARYFDIFRIDHVLGFFRMFAVPFDMENARHGFMIPHDKEHWEEQGRRFLTILTHLTEMLAVAEDLGQIPPAVPKVLSELNIPGTKVVRWQNSLSKLSPISMTTVATHDTCSLASFWCESHDDLDLSTRAHLLSQAHHSPSYLHINPLLEYLPFDPQLCPPDFAFKRINTPGEVNSSNWLLRMPCTLELLLESQPIFEAIKTILN